MNVFKYTKGLFCVTRPVIAPVIRANKSKLVWLFLFSALLGFIPSVKSGIESYFLNESNTLISQGSSLTPHGVFGHIFNIPPESGFPENLPGYIINGQTLLSVVFIYLTAIAVTFFFEYRAEKIKAGLNKQIFVAIREDAFTKALNTNPGDMPKLPNAAGNLTSSIQSGTNNISLVYNLLADTAQYLVLLVVSLWVLFEKAWPFGFIFIFTLSLQGWVSAVRAKNLKEERKELEKERDKLSAQTTDIIDKKEIILAFEQEKKYTSHITGLAGKYGELTRSLDFKGFVYSNISKVINEFERFLIPFFALLFILYFDRQAITSIGGIFFLITLYSRLSAPVLSILSQYNVLKEKEDTSNSLLELLKIKDNDSAMEPKNVAADDSAVSFSNVSFRYNESKPVFTGFTLKLPKNKTTIILGPSGCGKSSLAKIILGFWPIGSGEVTLMGQPLHSWSESRIRLFTSYISQGDYIVDDTVRDNLNWGNTERRIPDEDIMKALDTVCLVEDKNLQKVSVLDTRAKDLSGGGQQRLSLARILLDDAPLLILDEPLTGVDVFTIRDIMPKFRELLRQPGRTVILISHKLSFVNCADYLVLLDKEGKITEQGEPKQLLGNTKSKFYELYQAAREELIV